MTTETMAQSDYQKYFAILRRRWLPAGLTFATVLGLTIAYVLSQTPVYRIQGQVLYKEDAKTSALLGLADAAKGLSPSGDVDRAIETELQIILSEPVLQRTVTLLKNRYPSKGVPDVQNLKKGLDVKNIANTNIIQITYNDTDREFAAQLVNQLMRVYIENDLKVTRSGAIAGRQFIISQLPDVRKSLYRADMALRQFKEQHKLTDLEIATKSNAENIVRLDSTIDQAQARLTSLNNDYSNLQKRIGLDVEKAAVVGAASSSVGVQSSFAEMQTIKQQLNQAQAQYQDDYPLVVDLKAKLKAAQSELQANIQNSLQGEASKGAKRLAPLQGSSSQLDLLNQLVRTDINRKSLANELSTLVQQRSAYVGQSTVLPELQQRERELTRELLAAETTYKALLQGLEEARLSENQTVGNARVAEPAQISDYPIAPNKTTAITAGALAGLLLAIALLYVLETMDTRIKRVEEAREIFGYTLLGTIPKFPETAIGHELAQLPVMYDSNSSLSEAYRMLQANLKFLKSDKPLKVIAISSSVAQEGKSTTCANLAVALNQMGHKVLVVDCDLRRPSQHQIWQLTNQIGLSDYLVGQVITDREAINSVSQGLDVITAGTLPPNPLGLIDSERMKETIDKWIEIYDFVLIDTPPVAVAADAAILSKLSDGLIVVTRPGLTDKGEALMTKNYLEQTSINVLGLVVNGIIPENELNNYYYYSYHHYSSDTVENKKENISVDIK